MFKTLYAIQTQDSAGVWHESGSYVDPDMAVAIFRDEEARYPYAVIRLVKLEVWSE